MRVPSLALLVSPAFLVTVFAQEVSQTPSLRKFRDDLLENELVSPVPNERQLQSYSSSRRRQPAMVPGSQANSKGGSFMGSLWGMVFGWLMLPFSFALIMVNEQNSARMETLHSYAKREVKEADSDHLEEDLDWNLVHTAGETSTKRTLEDPVFVNNGGVQPAPRVTNSVKLKRELEVYQHVEEGEDGEEHITQKWMTSYVDCSTFQRANQQYRNPLPSFLQSSNKASNLYSESTGAAREAENRSRRRVDAFGCPDFTEIWYADDVKLGVYSLPQELLEKLDFVPLQDEWSYFNAQLGYGKPQNPQIGDIRVKYFTCPCGPTTVMALQTDEASFLPYRMIPRFCLWSEEAKAETLQKYAEMSIPEYDTTLDFHVPGAFLLPCGLGCLLCCLCNFASRMIYLANRPSIFYIAEGEEDPEDALENMQSKAGCRACMCRIIAWLVMFGSILLIAQPFVKLVSFFPFIGPFFATLLGWSIALVACCGTGLISSAVMCAFYVLLRPLIVIPLATLVIGGIVAFNYRHDGSDAIMVAKLL